MFKWLGLLVVLCKRRTCVIILVALRPGQTDSNVNASLGLFATPFARPCMYMRKLALTLVQIKFARKSSQVCPPNLSQRKLSDVHPPIISKWNTAYKLSALICFFCVLRVLVREHLSPFGHSTKVQLGASCDNLRVCLSRALQCAVYVLASMWVLRLNAHAYDQRTIIVLLLLLLLILYC